jgi:hypothetical protein
MAHRVISLLRSKRVALGAKRTSTSVRHATGYMSTRPSTTLADLLTVRSAADPFSTMWASLRRWSSEEFEDGVADGGQSRLRRRPADSFFPTCCCKAAMLKEGVSDHRHKCMTVKPLPGSSLEDRLLEASCGPRPLDAGAVGL